MQEFIDGIAKVVLSRLSAIDNKKKELAAVNAVREAFERVPRVLPSVTENDKTPCVDGIIEVYSSENMEKGNLIGIIDIQVKGTTTKKKTTSPKFAVSVTDLTKYLEVYGGVLYFVVFMSADLSAKRIYYIQLLPYDLQEILNKKVDKGQKTIHLRFKELPSEPSLLQKLCDEYVVNQKRQKSAKYIGFGGVEAVRRTGIEFKEIQFGALVADKPLGNSLRTWINGTYQYGITAEGQWYVFDKMEAPINVAAGVVREISAGKEIMKTTVFAGEDRSSDYIQFGSFKLRFGVENVLEFALEGTFRERLSDAKFMLAILDNGNFAIDGMEPFRSLGKVSLNRDYLEEQAENLETIVGVLDELKLKHDFNPKELTTFELYQLEKLVAGFGGNRHVPLNGVNGGVVNLNIDIQNRRIKVIAKKQEDGLYVFLNPLSDDLIYAIGIDAEEEGDFKTNNLLPAFFCLNEEDFRLAANIDADSFRACITRLPLNEETLDYGAEKLLQMLQAYDSGAVCEGELLQCAEILANELLRIEPESEAGLINGAQIEKRAGKLTPRVKRKLISLIDKTDDDVTRICAYWLLDMHDLAEQVISGLDDGRVELLKQWPIAVFGQP